MTKVMADCLYTGISTDTGCFKFTNTTPRTHRIAAELMEQGADFVGFNEVLFESKSQQRLAIERIALSHLEYHFDNRCALMYVTREEIERTGVENSDLEGITSIPRMIEGVVVGITMRQLESGSYKVSVRTSGNIDACKICAALGGGGHIRAAGVRVLRQSGERQGGGAGRGEKADMNGILIVDKPAGWTSFDVIAKLRGALHTRKIGHSGTLDPLATGVLPLFVGGAVKAVDLPQNHQKKLSCDPALRGAHPDRGPRERAGRAAPGCSAQGAACGGAARLFSAPASSCPDVLGGQGQRPAALQGRPRRAAGGAQGPPHRDLLAGVRRPRRGGERVAGRGALLQGNLYPGAGRADRRAAGHRRGDERAAPHRQRGLHAGRRPPDGGDPRAGRLRAGPRSCWLPVDSVFAALPRLDASAELASRLWHGAPTHVRLADGLYRVYAEGAFLGLASAEGRVVRVKKLFCERQD